MNNTEQLRQLMTLDANINTTDIEERFERIAKMLFESFAIQKGEKKYLFKEIEFYFYNKNHPWCGCITEAVPFYCYEIRRVRTMDG